MDLTPHGALVWARTPTGTKFVKYSLVSVVAILISQFVLLITLGVLNLWSAAVCNIVAAVVATPPSYYLNRKWVWGKTGRSHLMKEVIPFWALAFAGLGLSTYAVHLVEHYEKSVSSSHAETTVLVLATSLLAYGVVWVVKFVIFNHWMFVDHAAKKAAKVSARASAGSPRPEHALEPGATANGAAGAVANGARKEPEAVGEPLSPALDASS